MGIIGRVMEHRYFDGTIVIGGIMLVATLFVMFGLPNIHADNDSKLQELDELRLEIDEKINDAKKTIEEKEMILKDLKKASDGTWTELLEIRDAEDELKDANDVLSGLRDDLFMMLREKSDILKIIRETPPPQKKDTTDYYPELTSKLGVILSNSCITMIKNGFDTTCPSYHDLIILDSSNTDWSGKFTTDENTGFFHRGEPLQKNSWRLYDFENSTRIFIDPPSGMSTKVKLITLVPNFDNYSLAGDMFLNNEFDFLNDTKTVTSGNNTKEIPFNWQNQTQESGRVVYHDRYVKNCNSAVIDSKDWHALLVDTINYLRNDCDPEFTEYKEREFIPINNTKIDITTSPNYQYDKWLKNAMNLCKTKCS